MLTVFFVWFALPFVATFTFDQFQADYQKSYSSEFERSLRRAIFEQNEEKVSRLNQESENVGTRFSLNAFADLTSDEFSKTYLMSPRPAPIFEASRFPTTPILGR